ncbi:MAG: hypothetical protein AUJ07_12335 [Crenarchaeota archaeon 13_1_40CM_3_53_5]|nr:MAG: hypothetical protein AUJ07_12335 [Crenarchaeota archaeon 13_1_40CM_3_53_5]
MLTMQREELFKAIGSGNKTQVEQMVRSNPDIINAKDATGVSAILYALYRGRVEIAELLAERKTSLDIFEAASLGKLSRVQELLREYPKSANAFSPDGFNVLGLAAHFGRKGVVELLVENGADVNAVASNPTGFTALTGALAGNHAEIARILVLRGANVNHRYEQGFSPLMLAVEDGDAEMTRFLIEHGADVNARTKDNKTALSFALEKGHQDVVVVLKDSGATQ